MPCNSDYLEPTRREEELRRAARLYMYILQETNKPIPHALKKAAQDIYCQDDYIPDLCKVLTELDSEALDKIVYNPKNRTSRDLADWWEDHQEADRLRIEKEKRLQETMKIHKRVLDKLSKEEIDALDELGLDPLE